MGSDKEMAVAMETRSASVSISRFKGAQPSRTIGMVWRKTSPLVSQLLQICEAVRESAEMLRKRHGLNTPPRPEVRPA